MAHEQASAARPHIVHIARECAGISAAGGVGDVVLQLSLACRSAGFDTTVILPHYGPFEADALKNLTLTAAALLGVESSQASRPQPLIADIPMSYSALQWRTERVQVGAIRFHGAATFTIAVVVAERFSGKRLPYTYTAEEARAIAESSRPDQKVCGAEPPPPDFRPTEGSGHFDYFAMNVLLQKASIAWIERLEGPIVVHCHDAHTAMLPIMARTQLSPGNRRFIVTAHNCGAAYRQRCPDLDFVAAVGNLPRDAVQRCVVRGEFDPFAAAALHADRLNTVSPGYAWEVRTACRPKSGGDSDVQGLSAFLDENSVTLTGITNGIDPALKGPEAIRAEIRPGRKRLSAFGWKREFRQRFAKAISGDDLTAKWGLSSAKRLGSLAGLATSDCLFTVVGRWTAQKGIDIAVRAAEEVFDASPKAALCVLGDGNDPRILATLRRLAEEYDGRAVAIAGFSPELASSIYAAGDFFLVPSRFEPCGLVDMIAQLNGNLPIVNQVGGLAKVIDGMTGLGYFASNDRANLRGLVAAMHRALALAKDPPKLRSMRRAADLHVRSKYGWGTVLQKYARLYGLAACSAQGPSARPVTGSPEPMQ